MNCMNKVLELILWHKKIKAKNPLYKRVPSIFDGKIQGLRNPVCGWPGFHPQLLLWCPKHAQSDCWVISEHRARCNPWALLSVTPKQDYTKRKNNKKRVPRVLRVEGTLERARPAIRDQAPASVLGHQTIRSANRSDQKEEPNPKFSGLVSLAFPCSHRHQMRMRIVHEGEGTT